MAYAEETPALVRLVRSTGDVETVTKALDAGAQDIDSAFQSSPHGYSAPLVVEDFPTTDDGVRLAAKLESVNLALASWELVRAAERKPTSRIARAYSDARAWLKMIREGRIRFDFLPHSAAGSGSGIAVIGRTERRLTDDVFDTFGGYRRRRPEWPAVG